MSISCRRAIAPTQPKRSIAASICVTGSHAQETISAAAEGNKPQVSVLMEVASAAMALSDSTRFPASFTGPSRRRRSIACRHLLPNENLQGLTSRADRNPADSRCAAGGDLDPTTFDERGAVDLKGVPWFTPKLPAS